MTLNLFSPPGGEMGNGSMKSKRYKHTDISANAANAANASNSRAHKNHGFKNPSLDSLRNRVDELELEVKRRDEELGAKERQIKGLQEQLAGQTRSLAELSEELQEKGVQLGKLQDVMRSQGGGAPATSRTPSVRAGAGVSRVSPNLSVRVKGSVNRRKGAKSGVSAEPTSRTYDSGGLPKFSFEKARVSKDVR